MNQTAQETAQRAAEGATLEEFIVLPSQQKEFLSSGCPTMDGAANWMERSSLVPQGGLRDAMGDCTSHLGPAQGFASRPGQLS